MGQDPDTIKREIEETRERIGETADAIGYKADVPSRMRENFNDRIEGAKQRVREGVETITSVMAGSAEVADAVNTVRSAASDATASMRSTVSDATAGVRSTTQRILTNPLGLVLGACAVGFLAGLALPVTELEQRSLGPLSQKLGDKVNVGDLVEHGKSVLHETAQAAIDSTRQHADQIADSL